jgi:hypothetical protein
VSDNRRTSALSERESGTAGESPRDPRTVSAAPRSESDNRRTSALEQPHPELCVWPACEYWDKIERCPCVTGKPDPSSDNRRTSALRVVGPFIRIERRWWIRWRGVWHRMPL